MRPFWHFIFIILLHSSCLGQTAISVVAGRYQYAGSCADIRQDVFTAVRHPAAHPSSPVPMAGIYSEKAVIPGATSLLSLAATGPVAGGHWGLLVDHRGMAGFGETQAGLGYGMKLSDGIMMGVRINYYRLWIAGYGRAAAFPVEWGALCRLSPELLVSLHLYNLFGARPGNGSLERLPVVVRFGMGYVLSDKARVVVEVMREEGRAVSLQPMLYYQPLEKLFFRTGFGSSTRSFIFSGGHVQKRVRMEVFFHYQALPGWTSGLGIQLHGRTEELP